MGKKVGARLLKNKRQLPRKIKKAMRPKSLGVLCGEIIYTVYGVSELISVSELTVYRAIHKGKLEAGKAGKEFRILESQIYEWIYKKK